MKALRIKNADRNDFAENEASKEGFVFVDGT